MSPDAVENVVETIQPIVADVSNFEDQIKMYAIFRAACIKSGGQLTLWIINEIETIRKEQIEIQRSI